MTKRSLMVVAIGAAVAMSAAPARAESADTATCDRLAAFPDDPDKPAGIAGRYEIPGPEIATALKACEAAANAADAPSRIWFELGRAYEFSRQPAEALKAYRKAIDAGSTSAMVGLGGMYANGSGIKANPAEARKLFEQAGQRAIRSRCPISDRCTAPASAWRSILPRRACGLRKPLSRTRRKRCSSSA